ncbi:PAC2 family protein [Chloroflexota bacterium]
MKLGAFELNEPLPELREPHALVMLRPWIDVGSVGSLVLSWIEAHFNAQDLGKLARPGDFFDFTRYRPTIYVAEGQRQVHIPNTHVTYGKQKAGNDFLFLHLLEPHNHSEDYVDAVLQLLKRFDVKRYCLLGSMYDYMPHTRPLLVTGGAVGQKKQPEADKMGIRRSNYRGPTTITSLISQLASPAGIETMSFIVHLPQYTQLEEDYMGTVRIMEVLSSLYNLPKDESYITNAERQYQQISEALEKNPQLRTIVEQLESHYDERTERDKEEDMPRLSPEVEKFLAEMDRRFREG